MDLRTVRGVAFDLDGTLAESKTQMDADMAHRVLRLASRMPVAVISGASWKQFETQMLSAFPHDADFRNMYLFSTSASTCYVRAGEVWEKKYEFRLTESERKHILTALHEALIETGLDTPTHRVWGERIEDRGSQITFSGLGQLAPPEEKKVWDPDMKIRAPLREALMRRLPGFAIRANAHTSIDITHPHIHKAFGVRQFESFTGIPNSAMLYIGDGLFEGGNDYVVLETGIPTFAVQSPSETAALIDSLIDRAV